jgi:hypothetical protein
MIETLEEAKEELKRVDHLIYVSLKYTRTVDVIRNVLSRLLSSLDFTMLSLLKKAIDENKLFDIPESFKAKCDETKQVYRKDEKIVQGIDFYVFLKKLDKAEYKKEQEYRRHVAMIVHVDGKETKLDIDSVTQYYKNAKEYIEYVETIIKNKK